MGEQYTIAERMKQLRNITGFNRAEFARQQGIPLRTIEEWEAGRRKMPEYVLRLLAYKIQLESSKKDQRIHIIQDENNKSIVLINDMRFWKHAKKSILVTIFQMNFAIPKIKSG